MKSGIVWPLVRNVIRARSENNTFGMVRKYQSGANKPHQGWDFEAVIGEPAYAIADGKIEFVDDRGDYGKQLCMSFSMDSAVLFAFYAHLSRIHVKAGRTVKANTVIAACGNSGNAANLPLSENHLHFEIRSKKVAGLGLAHRISPIKVFGICPLSSAIAG